MWVLVFWLCTQYTCVPTITPGYYTQKEDCEDAMRALQDANGSFSAPIRSACIKAPDNIGYE